MGGSESLDAVRSRLGRERGEPSVHMADQGAVPALSVVRQSANDRMPGVAEGGGESEACAVTDAKNGMGGDQGEGAAERGWKGAENFAAFAAGCRADSAELGVGDGRQERTVFTWFELGPVQALRVVVASVEDLGGNILHRGVERGMKVAVSGDLQHGPGRSVHQQGLYLAAGGPGVGDQEGRPRSGVRQDLHRASVADGEVRRHLSARLRERTRAVVRVDEVLRVLLLRACASVAGLPDAVGGIPGGAFAKGVEKARELLGVARKKWGSLFWNLTGAYFSGTPRPGKGLRGRRPPLEERVRALSYFPALLV